MSKKIIAICGKGGVGKTAFTAMLSTALVESGRSGKLLLIDADPAIGLPNTVGIHVDKTIGEVREAIIKAASIDVKEAQSQVAKKIDYMILEALIENDHLALLAMGRSESMGCYCSVNGILRDAIDVLSQKFDTILIDGEAGIEQINRQVMRRVNDLIILTDASHRGLQTVSFILDMAKQDKGLHCDRVGQSTRSRGTGCYPGRP
jgi:CO dehydrogenase maturation factor